MSLTPGTRLGPYEILAAIGEGGMGEVYRAKDPKLNRDVALKILPEAFTSDAERLARFRREAQVLASLNHPNIAAIFGFEDSGATHALVMELVDGEDLAAHIARGPISVGESLPIARQIADALEAAHEQGIIHRDLKPANIKVRADGRVKVLDFGLAKAMDPPSSGATAGTSGSATNSPTMTSPAMTQMGVILGTAAYMSPEQAKGKAVDKRADIWAFGVVLYEMLSGRRAFHGDDVSDLLVAVLSTDVDLGALPATTPPRLRTLIRDCLIRDPKQRLRDIGDARLVLDKIIAGAQDDAIAGAAAVATHGVPVWRRVLPWALAGVLGSGLVVGLWLWAPWRVAPAPALVRLSVEIGADATLAGNATADAILSPDGQTMAFVGVPKSGGLRRLFVRRFGELQATALAGTDGAFGQFFSPDGQWLGFFGANGQLSKVSVTGGAAVPLCDAPVAFGGTWLNDDTIIFAPLASTTPLMRVSSAGGKPEPFSTFGTGAVTQRWPQGIAGRFVLYTEHANLAGFDAANLVVVPASAEGKAAGTPKIVVRGGYYGHYVPSGHIIYLQQGTLFAVRFDLVRLETVGQAVPVLQGVTASPTSGAGQVALSSNGTLVYRPGAVGAQSYPIDWMTRDGRTAVLRAAGANWSNPRFSLDGQKLALEISDGKQSDIWIYDWTRDTLAQLTFDPHRDQVPIWTPDSRRIAFASDRAKPGTTNLYLVNADGTGTTTRLSDSPNYQAPASWHPDGKILAFHEATPGGLDLMTLAVEGDAAQGWKPGKPAVFVGTPATVEVLPEFSPDGRWIAYFGREAGVSSWEVYVRPFPGPGGPRRISSEGGSYPRWSARTHELLFLNQRKIMVASYTAAGESFQPDKPREWSPTRYVSTVITSSYDLHPDGKRVAVLAEKAQADAGSDKVVFLFNFFDELNRLVPVKK